MSIHLYHCIAVNFQNNFLSLKKEKRFSFVCLNIFCCFHNFNLPCLPSAWEVARKMLDCRDWVWGCFFDNESGFDQFWLFCFLRSWSTREEPLWMKSRLPKTLGLAKPWTLSKRPQAHSRRSSPSRPCHPKRAVHSSSQTQYQSTKNNTSETLEDSSSGLSSWGKDKRQECRLEVKFFSVFHSFWCDPFQRGQKNNSCFLLNSYFPNCLAESHVLIPSYFYTLFYMTRC